MIGTREDLANILLESNLAQRLLDNGSDIELVKTLCMDAAGDILAAT